MHATVVFLLAFAAVCLLGMLAHRLRLAAPIAFVIGGVGLGFVPEIAAFDIPPHYILFIFLPPLLMEAAYFTSVRDFKQSLRPILQLAIGLVLATMFAVGFVAKALVPGMTFALGCVLGAIISPPDAVAATAMLREQPIPKRIVHIIEGESLVNDATGLVVYGFAVAAVVSGTFSLPEASFAFAKMALGGCVFGIAGGWAFIRLFPLIREPSVEILATFFVPFAVYAGAEMLHVSGVLAVVIAGLYVT